MTHGKEIRYKSYLPDGVKVWMKCTDCEEWELGNFEPNWLPSMHYVTDDKWAELAKQLVDDPEKVEFRTKQDKWRPTELVDVFELRKSDFSKYRIKPKYVYQWLYTFKLKGETYFDVTKYLPEDQADEGWIQIKESRKEANES